MRQSGLAGCINERRNLVTFILAAATLTIVKLASSGVHVEHTGPLVAGGGNERSFKDNVEKPHGVLSYNVYDAACGTGVQEATDAFLDSLVVSGDGKAIATKLLKVTKSRDAFLKMIVQDCGQIYANPQHDVFLKNCETFADASRIASTSNCIDGAEDLLRNTGVTGEDLTHIVLRRFGKNYERFLKEIGSNGIMPNIDQKEVDKLMKNSAIADNAVASRYYGAVIATLKAFAGQHVSVFKAAVRSARKEGMHHEL